MDSKTNQNLTAAKVNKADEFYTQMIDIEKELCLYPEETFRNKVVFCNADDSRVSNFYLYFKNHFDELGLKKLYSLGFIANGNGIFTVYENGIETTKQAKDDGSFESDLSKKLLKESDIVVTNPPFSLFGKFVKQLYDFDKKFILLGNINSLSHIGIFEHFINGDMWLGGSIHSGDRAFNVPDNYDFTGTCCWIDEDGTKYIRVKGVRWFTNCICDKSKTTKTILTKTIDDLKSEQSFEKYDTYDAYNVNSIKDIPYDIDRETVVGCPITAIDKVLGDGLCHFEDYSGNKLKFKIIGQLNSGNRQNFDYGKPIINKKMKYKRLLIKRI